MGRTVIVAAVRTAVGRIKGKLAPAKPEDIASLVIKEAVKRSGIDPARIDEVIYSNLYAHEISNMGRYAALAAGLPNTVPAVTVDRRCGSSLTAISFGDALIQSGNAECVLCGGVEMDSRRPYVLLQQESLYSVAPPAFRVGTRVGPSELSPTNMGLTAETLAEMYKISREECDEFSVESHMKAAMAQQSGKFNEQIIAVTVNPPKAESYTFDKDEAVRAECSIETLSKLRPSFKENGVCTAGNSSPMSDGASAVLLMSEELAKECGCEILGYIGGFSSVGVDPKIMGIGPVYAVRKLLAKTSEKLENIDLIELNEAFASQSIACIRELNLDPGKVNVNGGAIALGHPLAATGGVLLSKLVYEMKFSGLSKGIISFCCGGGQGVAMLIERE